jgi:NADPH:quinone reductase-like Zn-dependent oxidoreductase
VCSTKNIDLVRSIGADQVIDYTKEDFTKNGQTYDLIVATAGYRSVNNYIRALTPTGIYVCTGGAWRQIFDAAMRGRKTFADGKKLVMLTMNPNYDFASLKELLEAGKVKSVIDRCYPLSEIAAAFQYYEKRRARGKVVITVVNDQR